MASSYITSTASSAFRFTDLPTELRIRIYRIYLKSPKEVTLRLSAELAEVHNYPGRKVHPALTIKDTAILRVSHGIHDEALSVFYAQNRFHYIMQRTLTCWPPRFSVHLSMIRHISLEYHDTSFGAQDFQQYRAPLDDTTIGCLVTQLIQHAAQLRTFSLYITANPRFDEFGDLMIHLADTRALWTLRARLDKFTIVTYGPHDCSETLRVFIAPQVHWVWQDFRDWPRITMHWELYSQIYLRPSVDLFRYDKRVRAWHTSRLGSVGTELWEEPQRERFWDSYQEASRYTS